MTDQRKRERPDDYFSDWKEREALAEAMIPQVGRLAREKNVKCLYLRSIDGEQIGYRLDEDSSLRSPG